MVRMGNREGMISGTAQSRRVLAEWTQRRIDTLSLGPEALRHRGGPAGITVREILDELDRPRQRTLLRKLSISLDAAPDTAWRILETGELPQPGSVIDFATMDTPTLASHLEAVSTEIARRVLSVASSQSLDEAPERLRDVQTDLDEAEGHAPPREQRREQRPPTRKRRA